MKQTAPPPAGLTADELERYRRHIVLPGVGPEGQARLKRARVALVGVGGLGAPAGLYLAAAGVGGITLVDDDRVETTNLQRQVLFGTADVGRLKVDAARDRLAGLNPGVRLEAHPVRLSAANAMELLRGHDIVIDGADNFATHYLVNDACVMLGIPHVHGSILRFEGQVSLFGATDGPCYRCLYPAPPAGESADCSEAGVLGVLPGVVGSIQAAEAIKWIVQTGTPLRGRLLRVDALTMEFRELAVARDPDCPVCGANPTIRSLADGGTCPTTNTREASSMSVPEITAKELKRRLDAGEKLVVLDVREPHEFQAGHISELHIPMGEIPARVHELDPSHETVVYCRSGNRSARVTEFLQSSGFDRVWNLKGGIIAWAQETGPAPR